PFAIVHIKEEIESRIRKHVDIVRIREKMNPFLRERIEKEGIYA
ncbi:MAG: nucleotidyltransferase, partial [Candidatus Brocadia sp.]|nr:nucleotidyltransferase [Candidatus Brocadia sp.]